MIIQKVVVLKMAVANSGGEVTCAIQVGHHFIVGHHRNDQKRALQEILGRGEVLFGCVFTIYDSDVGLLVVVGSSVKASNHWRPQKVEEGLTLWNFCLTYFFYISFSSLYLFRVFTLFLACALNVWEGPSCFFK